jgi:hypothetical protein
VDWDDLYPPAGGGVWYYHDAANNRFIVEYDSVRYYSGSIYDKYEIVLYDTTQAAADGNCEFTFQYLVATGLSSATVGEQDPTRAIAIQVLFDGSYHRGASTITAGRAIKYTTDEPRTGLAEETGVAGLGRARFSVRPTMFRGRASVRFGLARAGAVHLAVYDMTGRQVRELAAQTLPAGTHAFAWDGRDDSGRRLAQGVYVVRLDAGGEKLGVKAVLLQ